MRINCRWTNANVGILVIRDEVNLDVSRGFSRRAYTDVRVVGIRAILSIILLGLI